MVITPLPSAPNISTLQLFLDTHVVEVLLHGAFTEVVTSTNPHHNQNIVHVSGDDKSAEKQVAFSETPSILHEGRDRYLGIVRS